MTKRIVLILLVLLTSALAVQAVFAREFADIYTECGLGAMIAPHNAAVAAVTNVTWDLGTTAISSDISSPESCKGGQEKVALFINDAYEMLETDLACGSGDYLDMLVDLTESEIQSESEFVDTLRTAFAAHVAQEGYSDMSRFEKAEALYDLVYANTDRAS